MKNAKILSACATLLVLFSTTALSAQKSAAPAATAMDPQTWQRTLEKMPAGRALEGAKVHAANFCAGCHGAEGVAVNEMWPSVVGQPAAVTMKSLVDYRDGRRSGDSMAGMMAAAAKKLTDQNISDLAAFYEKTPLVGKTKTSASFKDEAALFRMVRKGDSARTITPCAACHGLDASGNPNGEVPRLHGQNALYLEAALKQYRASVRSSDMLSEMRFFSRKLTDDEIHDLALYYATWPKHAAESVKSSGAGKQQSEKSAAGK